MRLLNVNTLELEEFFGSKVPKYAALSHFWTDEEVSFQDITNSQGKTKKGWTKVVRAAEEARRHNCNYVWIDTCCIDKTSSAELSEAINSMFRWYRDCRFCFAYLGDVVTDPVAILALKRRENGDVSPRVLDECPTLFEKSRWFTRGWTLQELIAPSTLYFYNKDWIKIGSKSYFAESVSKVTTIGTDVLLDHTLLPKKSIAHRMAWAANRETTREEDIAYCLMGIFDVNMPLLYGEGEKAFIRLQEEILKRSSDHSLFAWNHDLYRDTSKIPKPTRDLHGVGILALHPCAFGRSADIVPFRLKPETYAMTNRGLQIRLYVKTPEVVVDFRDTCWALLSCQVQSHYGTAIGIPVRLIDPLEMSNEIKPDSDKHSPAQFSFEFCRVAGERLLEISLPSPGQFMRNVYLSREEYLTEPEKRYYCDLHLYDNHWSRSSRKKGITLQRAMYSPYPLRSVDIEDTSSWDFTDETMVWPSIYNGVRAVLSFGESDRFTFMIVCDISRPRHGSMRLGIYTRLTSTTLNDDQLRKVLLEDIPFTYGNVLEPIHAKHPLWGSALTAKLTLSDIRRRGSDFLWQLGLYNV